MRKFLMFPVSWVLSVLGLWLVVVSDDRGWMLRLNYGLTTLCAFGNAPDHDWLNRAMDDDASMNLTVSGALPFASFFTRLARFANLSTKEDFAWLTR